jgi:hypothetical protein
MINHALPMRMWSTDPWAKSPCRVRHWSANSDLMNGLAAFRKGALISPAFFFTAS